MLDLNIRVNALSPGGIETPLHLRGGRSPEKAQAVKDKIAAQVPLGRLRRAHKIAAAALFLASDDSRYILRAELVVDGGVSQI